MAKHKKTRKSEPTPDPGDSKKIEESKTEKNDIPPTENISPPTENASPPPAPVQTAAEKDDTTRKLNKLFWLRIGIALIGGSAATFIFGSIEGEERRWASIGFMIIIFIVTIGYAKAMRMQLARSDRKKLVTQGMGSYVFLYLFMWIVSYTLVNINTNQILTVSPIT